MAKETNHRLPNTVRPEKYTIELRPDLNRFTFRGEESVALRILRPAKTIVLHASQLEVTKADLRLQGGRRMPAAKIEHMQEVQRLQLTFETSISRGAATLHLVFSGVLNDELAGFYRSKYTMADGKEGYMAATQFESTDARRAFPCWDEPAAKATFQVSLVAPDGMAAVSNTPIAEAKDLGDGTRLVRFAETPRMATYLLAFVVGPLEALGGQSPKGTKVGVRALSDQARPRRWGVGEYSPGLPYMNENY